MIYQFKTREIVPINLALNQKFDLAKDISLQIFYDARVIFLRTLHRFKGNIFTQRRESSLMFVRMIHCMKIKLRVLYQIIELNEKLIMCRR